MTNQLRNNSFMHLWQIRWTIIASFFFLVRQIIINWNRTSSKCWSVDVSDKKIWSHNSNIGSVTLHWLPVRFWIEFKILLLVYKCMNGAAPSYLVELLSRYVPSSLLRSGDWYNLNVPRISLGTCGGQSFSCATPQLWNQLPLHVKNAPSPSSFKSQLKQFCFHEVFVIFNL